MSRRAHFRFRLFIAGNAQNSVRAAFNLSAMCRSRLPGRHEIEVVDVFKDPKRALEEGIFMTPTLVKLAPSPASRIVGTLSQEQALLQFVGLEPLVA